MLRLVFEVSPARVTPVHACLYTTTNCLVLLTNMQDKTGLLLAEAKRNKAFVNVADCPAIIRLEHRGLGRKEVDLRLKLLWNSRLMKLLHGLLARLGADAMAEVVDVAQEMYNEFVGPHHSWVLRQFARPALKSAPRRERLLSSLGYV